MTLKTIPITLLTTLIILAGYYGYKKYIPTKDTSIPTTSDVDAIVTNPKIVNEFDNFKLPEGEQVYNITHGNEVKGPKASQISYKPLSIIRGKKQTITVTFPATEVVSSAIIFLTTDNLEDQKLVLEQVKKTNTWSGSWIVTDTINKRYSARLFFVGPSGTYNIVSTFI